MKVEQLLRKRIQEILQASMLELDPLTNVQPLEFNQDEILAEPDDALIDETDGEEKIIEKYTRNQIRELYFKEMKEIISEHITSNIIAVLVGMNDAGVFEYGDTGAVIEIGDRAFVIKTEDATSGETGKLYFKYYENALKYLNGENL